MAYCKTCGFQIDDAATFCPQCGTPVVQQSEGSTGQAPPPHQHQHHAPPSTPGFMNTPDTTGQYTQEDINANKGMAVLSYLWILVLVPLFAAQESKYARFHANQGLILLIMNVILGVLITVLSAILLAISWRLAFISTILNLLWLPMLGLHIFGIVNAVNGKAKELPLVGKFKLIK